MGISLMIAGGDLVAFNEGSAKEIRQQVCGPRDDARINDQKRASIERVPNDYGNNRMAATLPFERNDTMKTDWSGNVGF